LEKQISTREPTRKETDVPSLSPLSLAIAIAIAIAIATQEEEPGDITKAC